MSAKATDRTGPFSHTQLSRTTFIVCSERRTVSLLRAQQNPPGVSMSEALSAKATIPLAPSTCCQHSRAPFIVCNKFFINSGRRTTRLLKAKLLSLSLSKNSTAQSYRLHRPGLSLHRYKMESGKVVEGQTLVIVHRHEHVRRACLVSCRIVSYRTESCRMDQRKKEKRTDTRELNSASSVISRGLQVPPVSSHEVFNCLLTRRKDKRETNSGASFHFHCQGGQCAHSSRGEGGEHVKCWSCTELGVWSPSRQGGGGIIAARIVPYRIVSYRIVSPLQGYPEQLHPLILHNDVECPTIVARIHCVGVPVNPAERTLR